MNEHIESIKVKEEGFVAGLKTLGSYALGFIGTIAYQGLILKEKACKAIGLPFYDSSLMTNLILFNNIPGIWNTKKTDTITHYDECDVEINYWSDKSITQNIINVRHKTK